MKRQLADLSRRYSAALREHLQVGPKSRVQPKFSWGQKAVTLGLEKLDLTRIHKKVMADLVLGESSVAKKRILKRAELFLNKAVVTIEKTHRRGTSPEGEMKRADKSLRQLTATNRHLNDDLIQRRTTENALRKSGKNCTKLLRESQQLQGQLRRLTRQLLSRQEVERKKISHELYDGIAQILLGINVRLLTLKKAAGGSAANLNREIATTQRVLEDSVRSIDRFARELDSYPAA